MVLSRYDLYTDLQWRVPPTVMTVESFVYLGLVSMSRSDLASRWIVAGIGFLLGSVGAISMRRLDLSAVADRLLLDVYESRMNNRGLTLLLIPHRLRLDRRITKLRELQETGCAADPDLPDGLFYGGGSAGRFNRFSVRVDQLMVRFPPGLTWSILMILTAIGALVLAAMI
jgi:hypothetical protein